MKMQHPRRVGVGCIRDGGGGGDYEIISRVGETNGEVRSTIYHPLLISNGFNGDDGGKYYYYRNDYDCKRGLGGGKHIPPHIGGEIGGLHRRRQRKIK